MTYYYNNYFLLWGNVIIVDTDDENNLKKNLKGKSELNNYKKDFEKDKKASGQINKTFSRRRGVLRIVVGFFD